ncbi:MAG: zinc ribbon domain-containing protein [Gammaproteobacteria bacterium]|nr:zinc ribbon domain-containing protein [Gammaproteobacteria bacterium]MDE0273547.1 zinc ribbon domain-containing protein [Gammaproteobacteria bacterium]
MMKPCSECGEGVSSRAKVCPHCGIKKPQQSKLQRGLNDAGNAAMGLGCLLTLLAFLALVLA